MAISPVLMNGTVQRVQDYATLKHSEDSRAAADQSSFQAQFSKQVQEKSSQVKRGDDAQNSSKRQDAKEKGKNEYFGDGGRRRQKGAFQERNGKAVQKNPSSFDMKI